MGPSYTSGGYAGLGRLNCVAFRPGDANTLYVGAASGGIWKTSNGGSTWTPLGDNNTVLGVSDIIVIAGTPDVLYIATGDKDGGSMWSLGGGQFNDNNSVGVLKSTDGGATWSTTGLSWTASLNRTVSRLLKDPGNNSVLYAATSIGIYKTADAGASWTLQQSGSFIDMEMNPSSSSTLYASTKDYWGNPKIYYTTNGGTSWYTSKTFASTDYRVDLAVTAANSNYVYAIVANRGGGLTGIEQSINSGAAFSQVFSGTTTNMLNWDCNSTASGGQGSYDLCIAADPTDENIVFVGGINTWRSTDGGSSWSLSNHWTSTWGCGVSEVHADQHFLAYQNGTSVLYECNDGGLYKTTNNGSSWTHHGSGLVTSQVYRLGVSQSASNYVMTGLQDNGSKAYIGGSWSDVMGGDGFECAIDPTTTTTQYGSLYYGRFKRTTNTWSWETDITHNGSSPINGLNETGHWCTPFLIDPNTNTTLYVGMKNVWKSTNQGSAWTKLSPWSSSGSTLRSLAVAPSNSNYIYTATQSSFYRTTDGGSNWSANLAGPLPTSSRSITYISVKSNDPQTVWVSMGGYDAYGVYESTDGGSTWVNISTGLPSLPVMCVIQNKQNTSQVELYAGTDVGVYVKVGTSNWTLFYNGLPNVVVTELDIYYDNTTPANSRIRAATYGRGLWESDLYTAPVPYIDLEITVFLEGPFHATEMNSDLITYLPLNQPYNIYPWFYTGTENVAAIPDPDIVDWILVELRDAGSAASASGGTAVDRQACFILKDGSIVDINGSSNPQFNVTINQGLYVVVWHRNHIGIISNNALTPSGNVYTYDFSSGENMVYGGNLGHKLLAPGFWGMFSGDCDRDGSVGDGDKSSLWDNQAATKGYLYSDCNLDINSDNTDKNKYWYPNIGEGSQVPN